jgi:Papain family cysteine protease
VVPQLSAIPAARRSRDTGADFRAADAPLPDAPPPDSVDLRRDWLPVSDQGHTASCVGWAVAESLRWYLVEAGRLAPDQRLSSRHIWMAAKETDDNTHYPTTFLEESGTSLKSGLDVVRRLGAVLETDLPWEGALVAGSPDDYYKAAGERRILSYFNLGDDSVPDRRVHFDGWRRWLAHSGPVGILLALDKSVDGAKLETFDKASVFGSHAAALYGYGPDHFLLRSTWGQQWGEGGYARMSLDYTAQAVIESYGVIV